MDIEPVVVGELQAWGVAVAVGLGIVIATMCEIYLRQMEWQIDEMRNQLMEQQTTIEWLLRARR